VTSPERAQAIRRTFKTAGFQPLIQQSAEGFKKDGALVEAARCYAQIGQKDQALALLEKCYEQHCSSIVTLKAEPDFDVLRTEGRFQNLLQKLGLDQH
jgi:hypothetical protein